MVRETYSQRTSVVATRFVDGRLRRHEIGLETAASYRKHLWRFCDLIGDPLISSLAKRHVEDWRERCGLRPSSLRTQLSQLRVFSAWCLDQHLVRRDFTAGVKPMRQPRSVPRSKDAETVARLLDVCDDRLRLAALLMVQEGLRRVEVCRLQTGDVDPSDRTLFVTGKAGHERYVPISDETWAVLRRVLEQRGHRAGALIESMVRPGRPIAPDTLGNVFRDAARTAGVQVRPHDLRHTCITDIVDARTDDGTLDLRDVQAFAGHATLGTTARYSMKKQAANLRGVTGGRRYTA